jgi:hypothetical protein
VYKSKIGDDDDSRRICRWNEKIADICLEPLCLPEVAISYYLKAVVTVSSSGIHFMKLCFGRKVLGKFFLRITSKSER